MSAQTEVQHCKEQNHPTQRLTEALLTTLKTFPNKNVLAGVAWTYEPEMGYVVVKDSHRSVLGKPGFEHVPRPVTEHVPLETLHSLYDAVRVLLETKDLDKPLVKTITESEMAENNLKREDLRRILFSWSRSER